MEGTERLLILIKAILIVKEIFLIVLVEVSIDVRVCEKFVYNWIFWELFSCWGCVKSSV